jgi:hypothetical protein
MSLEWEQVVVDAAQLDAEWAHSVAPMANILLVTPESVVARHRGNQLANLGWEPEAAPAAA